MKKIIFLVIIGIVLSSIIGFSNSAEPPTIIIINSNVKEDINLRLKHNDKYEEPKYINKKIEEYYSFYLNNLNKNDELTIFIETSNDSFNLTIKGDIRSYNNIYTLDLKNKKLIPGKKLTRTIKLVLLRVVITLVIEGIIFYLLGFRSKKSWIRFLQINLFTQSLLNIWISSSSILGNYIIFQLIFGEIFVYIFEFFAFLVLVKEHSKLRRIFYLLIANSLSLVLGGYLITTLPI